MYAVRAQPRTRELERFWELLTDGTVQNQDPDGREIVASMKRAIMKGEQVEWFETCYCSPPLSHERSTVYDRFFEDMRMEPIEIPIRLSGKSFWNYLQNLNQDQRGTREVREASRVRYVPIRLL